jgi:EAL domain-containing protein (putative c-di-GMP-specific phosphodiesterase class I)
VAFLDIAERSGMIRDIDHWVIRTACGMIAEADRRGEELRLEVNVSGVSVSEPGFSALLEPHLVALGPLAKQLVIELTETAAVGNLAHATQFASDLARHGCEFALDDFGAGFGGFYYLKYLPCQYLKIDGEFIKTLPASPVDQVFVRAMVELAHGLGKQTIAEFVEDEETLDLLQTLGVDYGQGYHIGRPAPLTEQLHPPGRVTAALIPGAVR